MHLKELKKKQSFTSPLTNLELTIVLIIGLFKNDFYIYIPNYIYLQIVIYALYFFNYYILYSNYNKLDSKIVI